MRTQPTKNSESRRVLAYRIRELRKNKAVWTASAAYAEQQCRRGREIKVLASLTTPCELAHLLAEATAAGHTDLADARVDIENEFVLYEDGPVEKMVLTTTVRASDTCYSENIAHLWRTYQLARHTAAGRGADYIRYLRLKEIFEPNQ